MMLLILVVALFPWVVLSTLQFQVSAVVQCEPVNLTLVRDPGVEFVPTTLTLIPVNFHPVSIQIPIATADASELSVSFFPFAEGTSFVASFDNRNGKSAAEVSSIINVLPSPNTSCLPQPQVQELESLFTIDSTVSQCEEFSLAYNLSALSRAPSVRLFSPQGPSFALNLTADDTNQGTARYLMNFNWGKEIILLIDDGRGNRRTSPLTRVGGNSLSSNGCLIGNKGSGHRTSIASIIGGTIGGVTIFSLLCLAFILHKRRQVAKSRHLERTSIVEKTPTSNGLSLSSKSEKKLHAPNPTPHGAGPRTHYLPPLFAARSTRNSAEENPSFVRDSMSSWGQPIPEGLSPLMTPRKTLSLDLHKSQDLNLSDIENMLNTATVHSSRSSQTTGLVRIPFSVSDLQSPPHTRSHSSPSGAEFPLLRSHPYRGLLLVPSDIPTHSMYSSILSTDPFTDNSAPVTRLSSYPAARSGSLDPTIRPPPGAVRALPSPPGLSPSRIKDRHDGMDQFTFSPGRSTQDDFGDFYSSYGIAR